MLIRHSMTRSPRSVGPDELCRDVFEMFQRNCIRHAAVLEDGELVGVVSERDLTRALPFLIADLDTPAEDTVRVLIGTVMARDPRTCELNDPIDRIALEMQAARIGCMPVVDQGKLVGMVTITDLLRGFADHFTQAGGRAVTLVWTHEDRLPRPDIAALCVVHGLRLSTLFESRADSGADVYLVRLHGKEDAFRAFLRSCEAAHLGVLTTTV
ncbi:inosine 5'-monophosphate dehydrogenase [Planctomycetes bacterium Poly30]|uniref:Inosine 5'-monophosphate dehydrogenase n=1 Tax=Saltatorellus ferox TaxID=2528018 RepID=A0A518EZ65_9BACT|nr:inosine 5'-monophosphate dehydrogenase [Planctomycetes bacterium Poly30]